MKTNHELKAALNMVLARLESDPKTSAEWEVIRKHLDGAANYAAKVESLRFKFEAVERPKCPVCGRESGLAGLVDNACCAKVSP